MVCQPLIIHVTGGVVFFIYFLNMRVIGVLSGCWVVSLVCQMSQISYYINFFRWVSYVLLYERGG